LPRIDPARLTLEERVVQINRVAKVVKGGRRFSFSAIVVVGDGAGHVGAGLGKAGEVPEAIRKGVEDAKKNIIKVPMVGTTIPHEVWQAFGASKVMLKPASQGTGVIAGGSVRAVVEAAGIRDILSKSLGSNNPVNVVRATLEALRGMHSAEELGQRRGKNLHSMISGQPAPGQQIEQASTGSGSNTRTSAGQGSPGSAHTSIPKPAAPVIAPAESSEVSSSADDAAPAEPTASADDAAPAEPTASADDAAPAEPTASADDAPAAEPTASPDEIASPDESTAPEDTASTEASTNAG